MTDIAAVRLHNRAGQARTIRELTTLFDLFLIAVDGRRPDQLHTLEPVIDRLDRGLGDADCTVGVLAVGVDDDAALARAGPLAERVAVYADPDGTAATAFGLTGAPALVWVDTQPALRAVVDGWNPTAWRAVLVELARKLAWTRPLMPAPGDPAPLPAEPITDAATNAVDTPSIPSDQRPDDHDARLVA